MRSMGTRAWPRSTVTIARSRGMGPNKIGSRIPGPVRGGVAVHATDARTRTPAGSMGRPCCDETKRSASVDPGSGANRVVHQMPQLGFSEAPEDGGYAVVAADGMEAEGERSGP